MAVAMKMDEAPNKYMYKVFAGALVVLIVSIIVGLAGPPALETKYFDTYECPGGSHIWNSTVCSGVQLRTWNSSFITTLPDMLPYNLIFNLEATPYKWENFSHTGLDYDLSVSMSLWGKNDSENTWHEIKIRDVHSEKLNCKSSSQSCESFTLIKDEFIDYSYYQLEISLPSSPGQDFVGDVEFKLSRYTSGFSLLQIAYRGIYSLVIPFAALLLFVAMVKKCSLHFTISYEQKIVFILLAFTLVYNFPFFYGLTIIVQKWGWIINAVFETFIISLLLMFWFVAIDNIRRDKPGFKPTMVLRFQLVLVGIYASLTSTLFCMDPVGASQGPVYFEKDGMTVTTSLFWGIAVVYGSILMWLIYLVVRAIQVVKIKPHLMGIFLFMGVPTMFCIFSCAIGFFVGRPGEPYNATSLGFGYFLNLYNVYTLVMVAAVWPADARNSVTTSDEAEMLQFNE
eukprot:TRINITY_DN2211_c0_g1_i3.p1 TRINITY_DN2211_c0_g1~~TRINITY_DN2211_c0_g1_i3.p1  ORF type:complete len:454 (-),score=42.39 TRINITY_DN2211_c0_g1_i3:76-1437(-)